MRYSQLGNSDLQVSVVGLGTWAMGGDFWGKVDDQVSISTIREAIDSGINLIDTAPVYGKGHAEKVVGKGIKGLRDKVIIATKCGMVIDGKRVHKDLSPASIRKEVEDSLSRLDIDVIDLYQIHWPDPDPNHPLEDSLNELMKLRKQGKFKYLGVSNFDVDLLTKACNIADLTSLQPPYSLIEREIENKELEFCKQNNLGVLAYGSLGAGILTGKFKQPPSFAEGDKRSNFYPYFKEPYWSKVMKLVEVMTEVAEAHNRPVANVAINWLNQQPSVTTALVGAKKPEQAKSNALAGEWELSQEEIKQLTSASDKLLAPIT